MKKNLLVLGLMSLILFSCSSSDNADVNPYSEPAGFLKSFTNHNIEYNQTTLTNYYYNRNNTLAKIVDIFGEHIYEYDGEFIKTIHHYKEDILKSTKQYSYNTSGKLIGIHTDYFPSNYTEDTKYTYNADGTVTYEFIGGDDPPHYATFYFNSQNEIIKFQTVPYTNGYYEIHEFTYDDKPSPFSIIPGLDKIALDYKFSMSHNITSHKAHQPQQSSVGTVNMIFEYNQANFPTGYLLTNATGEQLIYQVNYSYY